MSAEATQRWIAKRKAADTEGWAAYRREINARWAASHRMQRAANWRVWDAVRRGVLSYALTPAKPAGRSASPKARTRITRDHST